MFCMPHLGHYSLQVKTKLDKLIKPSYPNTDFKVIFAVVDVLCPISHSKTACLLFSL